MPPLPFSGERRAVSEYLAVIVLMAAALGLAMALYQDYSSSFRLVAPPPFSFSYRVVDSGLGFEQVTAEFQFQGSVSFNRLLLNGTSRGYLSLAPNGTYVPADGGVEFFSVVIPLQGQLVVSNVTSAVVDGVVATSVNASAGRHGLIVVAGGNYSITSPSFAGWRQSGLDPNPLMGPSDLTKPASSFTFLVPMEPGSTLTIEILYPGGSAVGVIDA